MQLEVCPRAYVWCLSWFVSLAIAGKLPTQHQMAGACMLFVELPVLVPGVVSSWSYQLLLKIACCFFLGSHFFPLESHLQYCLLQRSRFGTITAQLQPAQRQLQLQTHKDLQASA